MRLTCSDKYICDAHITCHCFGRFLLIEIGKERGKIINKLIPTLILGKLSQSQWTAQPITAATWWPPWIGWNHEKPQALSRLTTEKVQNLFLSSQCTMWVIASVTSWNKKELLLWCQRHQDFISSCTWAGLEFLILRDWGQGKSREVLKFTRNTTAEPIIEITFLVYQSICFPIAIPSPTYN